MFGNLEKRDFCVKLEATFALLEEDETASRISEFWAFWRRESVGSESSDLFLDQHDPEPSRLPWKKDNFVDGIIGGQTTGPDIRQPSFWQVKKTRIFLI